MLYNKIMMHEVWLRKHEEKRGEQEKALADLQSEVSSARAQ
jgi:hypothetical protein